MRDTGLDEVQPGITIPGRNMNNLRYAEDTTRMAESEEELKSLLMKFKEESGKAYIKLNIQKTKIMSSVPITLWKIDVEAMETVTDVIFLGSEITADAILKLKNKNKNKNLLFGRKTMNNLDSIWKRRDINLPAKVHLVKAIVSPVAMNGCEWELDHKDSWVLKNWCFWTVVLEKTL